MTTTTKLVEQLENSTTLGEFLSLLDQLEYNDNQHEIEEQALYEFKWILQNSKLIGPDGEASEIGRKYEYDLSHVEDQLSLLRDIQKEYGDDVPFCREFNRNDPKHADHVADVVRFWKLCHLLQRNDVTVSLLDFALQRGLDKLAFDMLTKLLEKLDPTNAESIAAFRAYLEPNDLRRKRPNADISESIHALLDTAYKMLVSDVGLDYMRNYKALRDLHLTTNKERHQTSDGVPRITLLIHAHGADLFTGTTGAPSYEKPQKYHFEGFDGNEPWAGKLSVLFFGPGECDVVAYGLTNGSTADKWRQMIWSDAIPHDPDVDGMMVKLRPKLHEMYVDSHASGHGSKSGYELPAKVNDGEGGKTPWQDRSYSRDDPDKGQPKFTPGIVQIVQSFNNPKFDKFVGATLFSAALTAASPNVEDAARDMVNQWYKDKLLEDGMIKRLRLSQILKLCRAMGYKDVNIFDYSCRTMIADAPTPQNLLDVHFKIKDADFRKRQVAEVRRLEDRWPPALPPRPPDEEGKKMEKEAADEKEDDDLDVTDMWSRLSAVQQRRSSNKRTPSPAGGGGTQKRRRFAATKNKSSRRKRTRGGGPWKPPPPPRRGHRRIRGGTFRRSLSARTRPLRSSVTAYHAQPDGTRGAPLLRSWRLFGRTMRGNDKPSEEILAPDGTTVMQQWWFRDGKRRNEPYRANDQPAHLEYRPNNGKLLRAEWYLNGRLGRANDLPAVIEYDDYDDSRVYSEQWFQDGYLSRVGDKPTVINYDNSYVPPRIRKEQWYQVITDGHHRAAVVGRAKDQPAVIVYDTAYLPPRVSEELRYKDGGLLFHKFLFNTKFDPPRIDTEIYFHANGKWRNRVQYSTATPDFALMEESFYNADGQLHMDNDRPAKTVYNPHTETIVAEHWFVNGVPARANPANPTTILYSSRGEVVRKLFGTTPKYKTLTTDEIDEYIELMNNHLKEKLLADRSISSLEDLLRNAVTPYMDTHRTKDGKDLRTMFPFPRSYFLAKTGDVATVQIRSELDLIFVQHAAQHQLY